MSELAHTPRVAILASGGGTTAEAYARAIHEGRAGAEIGVVVASAPDAGILDRVQHWRQDFGFNTEVAVINGLTHPGGAQERGQTDEESEAIATLLTAREIRLVALLGYMRIVRGELIQEFGYLPGVHDSMYQARMLNTHPGPLPQTADTYGVGASARVLELGLSESRHTVHVVSAGIDEGPIVAEHPVAVEEGDIPEELNCRTQVVEKATIAYAIDAFLREQDQYLAGQ